MRDSSQSRPALDARSARHSPTATSTRALDLAVGEHGAALLGGQLQRLALARALLSKRPLLIVDEATTGLDELNRQRVVSAPQQRDADQTLVIVSHDDADEAWGDQVHDVESASTSAGQRGH